MLYTRALLSQSLLIYCAFTLLCSCDDNDPPPNFPDVPIAGEIVAGESTSGETLAGETLAGEIMAGESTSGEMMAGASMAGEAVAGEINAGNTAGQSNPNDLWGLRRECTVTLSYESASANQVQIAGSFTNWSERPLDLVRDGNTFTITLSPDQAELNLQAGQRYPYKFIVDGQWVLDPNNEQQQFDGDCVNSAFQVSDCERPLVNFEQFDTAWVDNSGQVNALVKIALGTNGQDLSEVDLKIDGEAIDYDLDPTQGTLSFSAQGLEQGKHRLSLKVTDQQGLSNQDKSLSFWLEERAFDWRDTPMYMLLVDRFANGDASTDAPVGEPVTYSADWHGGDLQGARRALETGYFDQLGIKAIWLSPINRQVEGHFADRIGGGRRFAAYHGYWPTSGREIDARYGGNEGLRDFVQAAHARGIRVLLDLINNQVHEEHEYYLQNPEWFRTGCVCGLDAGCGWSERPLDCLFASYLPDINWRVPGAEEQFIADALYWVQEFDVDGFRVDAVKHVETTSIYNLRSALYHRFEGDGLGERVWMFGETAVGESDSFNDGCGVSFDNGYQWIDAYTGDNALDGQFDFPSHHRIKSVILRDQGSYWDIDNAINTALTAYNPEALHVRFLGSHDSTRVASEADLDPRIACRFDDDSNCDGLATVPSQDDTYQRLKRAWLLLWTMPGTPLLYYGDEIALAGGNDPDSRRDMPWLDDLSDLAMSAPDQSPASISEAQLTFKSWLAQLAQLRQNYLSLTRGTWQTLWVWDDVYVYARYGDSHSGQSELSVMAISKSPTEQSIDIPIPEALRSALDLSTGSENPPQLGQGQLSPNAENDQFSLRLPAQEASLWVWTND